MGLRFLELHLGLRLHTASPTVAAWKAVDADHEPAVAPTLSLSQWVQLEDALAQSSGPLRRLLLAVFVVLLGVLRFTHLQCSTLLKVDSCLCGRARRGKTKVRGLRRPLRWSASWQGLTRSFEQDFRELVEAQGSGRD